MEIFSKFDPRSDVREVDQFGYVDINDAFRNGSVKGDLTIDEETYNDIDDPRNVGPKPRDSFEAIELGRKTLKKGRVKSEPSTE